MTTPRDKGTEPRIEELSKKADGWAELKVEMTAGFKRIDERFETLDGKFEKLDGKIDGLDEKWEGKIEKLDEKFDGKFDRLTFHLLTGAMAMITALLGVIATFIVTLIHVL